MRISDWSSDVCSSDLQKVKCLLAALGIAQSRYAVVPGGKSEVLELVAFIDEQVVHAHAGEVDTVILPLFNALLYIRQLVGEVFLADFLSLHSFFGDTVT